MHPLRGYHPHYIDVVVMSGSVDETGQACGIKQANIIATTHVKQSMY